MQHSTNRQRWLPGRSFIGLEINDMSVKAVEVVSRGGSFHIKAKASTPLSSGIVVEGRIKDRVALLQAISKTLAADHFKSKKVHFVLPSPVVMVRYMKLPDLAMPDLKKLVEFEIKHQIHLPFEHPYFDFVKLNGSEQGVPRKVTQIKGKRGPEVDTTEEPGWSEAAAASGGASNAADLLFGERSHGDGSQDDTKIDESTIQCDVMLVIAPREAVEEYAELLEDAQLKPASVEIKGLSLYRLMALLYPDSFDIGTYLVVDLNEISADVSIYDQGQLRITRSAAVTLKAEPEPAPPPTFAEPPTENGGLFAEFEVQAPQPSGFEQACAELAGELDRIINFFRYSLNNRNKEIHRVLVTGDLSQLPEVVEQLRQRMNTKVELIRSMAQEGISVAEYAVPIGLGLRGRS